MNNLREHGIAWYLYLNDHDDYFPKTGYTTDDITCLGNAFGGRPKLGEVRPLNRYFDIENDNSPNIEVFHCP
ncbi:unnamed protein product, partial [marine sediment metagenome]